MRLTPRWIGRRCGLGAAPRRMTGWARKVVLRPVVGRFFAGAALAGLLTSLAIAQQSSGDGYAGATVSVRFADATDAVGAAGLAFSDIVTQSVTATASASLIFQNAVEEYNSSRSYAVASGEDDDSDLVPDSRDRCLSTPFEADIDANGCARIQVDQDLDGVCNADASSPRWCSGIDSCPDTTLGTTVNANGCPVGAPAQLTLTKVAGSQIAYVGQMLSYTLTVTNIGPLVATNVLLREEIPEGLELTSILAPDGVGCIQAQTVSCAVGPLPVGEARQFTFVFAVRSAGVATNRATISSTQSADVLATATVELRVLDTPKNLRGTVGVRTVQLGWGRVGGAVQYQVEIARESNGEFQVLSTEQVTTDSVVVRGLINGTLYRFRVAALTCIIHE